jgi:hypothetical protein
VDLGMAKSPNESAIPMLSIARFRLRGAERVLVAFSAASETSGDTVRCRAAVAHNAWLGM